MKTTLTAFLTFIAFGLLAQTTTEIPRQEFTIQLSEGSLSIKPGESKTVSLSVLRSKSFKNGSVKLGTSSVLPAGVSISFEPTEGNIESSVATITVAPEAVAGTYSLILNGMMYHKSKGSVLKLEVAGQVAAKN